MRIALCFREPASMKVVRTNRRGTNHQGNPDRLDRRDTILALCPRHSYVVSRRVQSRQCTHRPDYSPEVGLSEIVVSVQ
jgi:hypothetical protein